MIIYATEHQNYLKYIETLKCEISAKCRKIIAYQIIHNVVIKYEKILTQG